MNYNSPAMNNWLGHAFEEVVFNHIDQVKQALGISGVLSSESAWNVSGTDTDEGMQIDLLIDRADRVVNVCEIKFCNDNYIVTSTYARKITNRIDRTSEMFKHKRSIASVLITTYGLKKTNIQAGSRKYSHLKTCSGRFFGNRRMKKGPQRNNPVRPFVVLSKIRYYSTFLAPSLITTS